MILRKTSPFFIPFILSLFFIGCGAQTTQNNQKNTVPKENTETMMQHQNTFAFRLFEQAIQTDAANNNKLISPLSIYMDFAMLYNGASGETKKAMQEALYIKPGSLDQLNRMQASLMNELPKADSSVTINVANAIWHRMDLTPKAKFLSTNQQYFNATIEAADFGNPKTISAINNWVSKNTQGKIPSLVDQISPGEVMFLLNAVYFKGTWTDGFNSRHTHDAVFHTATEGKRHSFMFKDDSFNYFKNEDLKIAELPYGNGSFSMFVILPSEKNDLYKVAEQLNPESFSDLTSEMNKTPLKLFLPKWETSYSADNLKENLTAMGMGIAFQNRADFSELFATESTKISQIKHKTYIKVDEEGTEAAAATSIGMVTTSMPATPIEEMRVNRPFIYLITERNTGAVLFIGTVDDPTKS